MTAVGGLVRDETELLARHVPLANARIIEPGCGKAELARRLLAQPPRVASVTALEVDRRQHAANLAETAVEGLRFVLGGAERIPFPEASFDGAMMLKSLHHVPLDRLDDALEEIRRVLVPGGWLYVSEPVYAGDFNDIVKLFHDEGAVRAAAYTALQRAVRSGRFVSSAEFVFDTELRFRDFDDFVDRIVRVTHSDIDLPPALTDEVRSRFQRFMTSDGARFVRQMRVNLLRKP